MLNQPMNPRDEDEAYIIQRQNIKAIILDMIAASFESTSVAIVWAFSEIFRHPRVMVRLQQELEAVVGRNRLVEESDLPKLTYLDMVVKETLITMRLVLSQLIHCFEWELPHELDMTEIFGLSLPRANHLLAKPTYRLLE
ncbi:hypothetical protein V6N13_125692 [Hibiscus sabdariffa]